MEIDELWDLEHLLQKEETDPAGPERDRAIGRRILDQLDRPTASEDLASGRRHEVFSAYVEERRRREPLPGRRLGQGLEVASWMLTLVSFFLGVGTARAALHYDGSSPVNLFWFLGTLVLVQVFLLVLLIVVMILSARPGRAPHLGVVGRFLAWLARSRVVGKFLGAGAAEAAWMHSAGRRSLYSDLLRWLVFARVQRAGTAFNLGALAATVLLLTFTDLAFGWSTTLGLPPEFVHRGFLALAGPVGWVSPGLLPDLESVRTIQWTRLAGGHFQGGLSLAEASERARSFGPLLLLALGSFGLLPRFVAMIFGAWRTHSAKAQVPLNTLAHERLLERLFPPRVERVAVPTAALAEIPVALPPVEASPVVRADPPPIPKPPRVRRERPAPPPTPEVLVPPAAAELLVAWGTLELRRESWGGLGIGDKEPRILRAGGADLAAEEHAVAALAPGSVRRTHFLVEEGVPPTKDLIAFLRRLRVGVGPSVLIYVHVVDAAGGRSLAPDERLMWERVLKREADPYLGLAGDGERPS